MSKDLTKAAKLNPDDDDYLTKWNAWHRRMLRAGERVALHNSGSSFMF